MAGTLLGKDQILKVNATYLAIFEHIKMLLEFSNEPVHQMRVHFLTEYMDTPELGKIFAALPFLSPAEKRALVRVAIFDVLLKKEPFKVAAPVTDNAGVVVNAGPETLKEYRPAQFNLNVATADAVKVEVSPTPPTEAHTPIVRPTVQAPLVQNVVTNTEAATGTFKLNVATVTGHQGA
jgi:hypothetical protein